MNELKDMLALSMLAYKQGQFQNSAKMFVAAMGMEGLDSFIGEITRNAPVGKLIDSDVPTTENTIAPSLASDFESLSSIVDTMAAEFSHSSYLDDGEFEDEARSSDLDDQYPEDEESISGVDEGLSDCSFDDNHSEEEGLENEIKSVSSVGPVRFKN